MHDIIAYLKDAVNRLPGAGVDSCYVVRDNAIYARNVAMQAGIEWPDNTAFTISADALDAALARMKVVQELRVEDDEVIIKSGRLKSTIRRVHMEPQPLPDFPERWYRSPPGLGVALDMVKDYVGDRSWMAGVRIMSGFVTAFHDKAGIHAEVEGLETDKAYLIPVEVAKFIAAQGDPDEMTFEKNAISFRWVDGRWVRTQLINDEMPQGLLDRIFEEVGEDAPVLIDQEWREALADAAALSDGTIGLSATGLQGIKENITTEVDLGVNVDIGHQSYWNAKMLGTVIERATAWNPENYDRPALFIGDGFKGVIAGVKR